MTGQQLGAPPPARKRRRWLVGLVFGWMAVVVVLGTWSVWHSPPTVPEQRDIAQAVPELQRAAGAAYAAADGTGRVVDLGQLELIGDCRITPVRHGYVAARDLTVYVREGDARAMLDAIAGALPEAYHAEVSESRGGTRLTMHADAGNFIGIDTTLDATAKAITLRLTSGCRPGPASAVDKRDPAAAAAPAELRAVLAALGGADAPPQVRAVACPDGGVAASYAVAVAPPADLASRMRAVSAGAAVVRSDDAAWAYRKNGVSVVVVPDGKQVRVSVGTAC
ncbi:hypothetical protein [Actinoplanes subtropicus]|uniref:hypothetical protein n=1 Tax=Actinoplanes subtropicus TaxID=543632 RepID=UPI001FDF56A8|nr:hypothetical protein [Actinoplanes subtropicus]